MEEPFPHTHWLDPGKIKKTGNMPIFFGAADRDRTGTTVARREILSQKHTKKPTSGK